MTAVGGSASAMHRFFIPPEWLVEDGVTIRGGQAHQIAHVLRLKPGDRFVVLDSTGFEYEAVLLDITRDRVRGRVEGRRRCETEPALSVSLYQALLKGDRLETVLQKCTELGVSEFILFESARCVARSPRPLRLERWRAIVTEAAEQSRRGKVPALQGVIRFDEACGRITGAAIMPWEGEGCRGIKEALQMIRPSVGGKIAVFIGPEGGFAEAEVELARSKGIQPVSLGKRILRAETASMAVVSAVLYEFGEM